MSRIRIQRDVLTDPSWWHWATTIPMLILHLSGIHGAIEAAIAICLCFTCAYLIRLRRWKPFPIQIRLVFLGLRLVPFNRTEREFNWRVLRRFGREIHRSLLCY